MRKSLTILIGILVFFSACNNDDSTTDIQDDENVKIKHGDPDGRVKLKPESNIELKDIIKSTKSNSFKIESKTKTTSYQLKLIAEVDPPTLDGKDMRASHVYINKNFAYVSYNLEGNEYNGGVDVFDIADFKNPQLLSQALLKNVDVNSLAVKGDKLFMAAAGDIDTDKYKKLSSPAFLGVLNLDNNILTDELTLKDVPSYAGTDVYAGTEYIYMASGDNGGVSTINAGSLEDVNYHEMKDARSVTFDGTNVIAFGAKQVAADSYDLKYLSDQGEFAGNTDWYRFTGRTTDHSKSILATSSRYVYMPIGEDGLKIYDRNKHQVIKTFPGPEIPKELPSGVNESDYVTNAVAVVGNEILLLANGAGGVYFGIDNASFEGEDDASLIQLLASADLGASANYVQAKKSSDGSVIIFVATGTGGLKILKMLPGEEPKNKDYNYLDNHDNKGAPIDREKTEVPDGTEKEIRDKIIKDKNNLIKNMPDDLKITGKTKLYLTYLNEYASYLNSLGFYTYDLNNPPATKDDIDPKTIIFPNCSKVGSGGNLERGDKVYLGEIDENTGIGFFLMSDAWDAKNLKIKNSIPKGIQYTNRTYNDGRLQHFFLSDVANGKLYLTFEDIVLNKSDYSFDDLMFFVETDVEGAIDLSKITDFEDL
jgi:hypothetical protein